MTTKTVKAPVLNRVATIDASSIDVGARTVKVAFASEEPYQRAFGFEILSVDAKSVMTDYLDTGASVLVNHNWEDLVGVVTEYSLDADKVARATVKFGRSARAEEVFQDVVDQVRRQISVGYMVKAMAQEDPIDGVPAFRVTAWQPFEVSFVTVAADPSVGVGKSLMTRDGTIDEQPIEELIASLSKAKAADDSEDEDEDDEEEKSVKEDEEGESEKASTEEDGDDEDEEDDDADADDMPGKVEEKAADVPAAVETPTPAVEETRAAVITVSQNDPAIEAEQLRVHTLMDLGEKLRAVDIAAQCIKEGRDIEHFKQLVIQSKSSKGNKMELGLTTAEAQRFSLIKALNAQLSGKWDNAGFEREVHEATAQLMKRENRAVNGVAIPMEVLTRTNNATSASAGGNTIQNNILGGSFIEMLYNALVLPQLGATFIEANSPFSLPKASRAKTAAWVSENGAAPAGALSWSQIPFTPKRIADSTQISKRLLAQSTVDIEALLMSDFAKTIALAIQDAAINGDGVGQNPLGILNQPGLQTVAFAAAGAPTFKEIVSMEGKIEDANLVGNGYLVSPLTKSVLRTTPIAANYPAFVMTGNEMAGYPVAVSKVAPADTVVFGSWSDLVIAHFGALDIVVNPFTFATQNLLEVSVGMDADVNVRCAESFVKGH